MEEKSLLTPAEAAIVLGVTVQSVYKMIVNKRLATHKWIYINRLFLSRSDVEAFVTSERQKRVDSYRPQETRREIPSWLRSYVLNRDGHKCRYCGMEIEGRNAHADHILPYSKGGLTTADNLAACCLSCNGHKKNRTPEQAGMVLQAIPHE